MGESEWERVCGRVRESVRDRMWERVCGRECVGESVRESAGEIEWER